MMASNNSDTARYSNRNISPVSLSCADVIIPTESVSTVKNTWCNINSVDQASRNLEIKCMCWGNDNESEVCVGLRNQTVCVFNTEESEITGTHDFSCCDKDVFAALEKVQELFLTCTESGLLKLWNEDKEPQLELNLGQHIERVRNNPHNSHIASGGKENDLKIWDLQKPTEPIFRAKNVRNDWLNLRVPVHIKDFAFFPNSQKICTCTAHHQVRLYDPSTSQRRPVFDMEWGEYPITSLSLHHNGFQAVVGNTHGDMSLLDLRKKGHQVHSFKGIAGSIRDIKCHSSQDAVASCGLDRFLRIHNITDKNLVSKHYLKSRLNCLLFSSSSIIEDSDTEGSVSENVKHTCDADDSNNDKSDDLWDSLAVVKTKTLKKKGETDTDNKDSELEQGHKKRSGKDIVDECLITDSENHQKKRKLNKKSYKQKVKQ